MEVLVIMILSGAARNGAMVLAWVTPMVLGRISEKSNMTTVKSEANKGSQNTPKIVVNEALAIAAPAVLATVFRVSMAAMGFPGVMRILNSNRPLFEPLLRMVSRKLSGTA